MPLPQPRLEVKRARSDSPDIQRPKSATSTALRPAMPAPLQAQTKTPESCPPLSPALDRGLPTTVGLTDNICTDPHSNTEDTQPYIRVADPDVVRVFVGPQKRLYTWHRKLLCAESPTMNRRLERRRAREVSVGRTPTVPTAKISDCVEAVDIVTKWLYDHEITLPTEGSLIFDIYVCAVKRDLERLQNRIMDDSQHLEMKAQGNE